MEGRFNYTNQVEVLKKIRKEIRSGWKGQEFTMITDNANVAFADCEVYEPG